MSGHLGPGEGIEEGRLWVEGEENALDLGSGDGCTTVKVLFTALN